MNLSNTQLFYGLKEDEITSLLDCLNAEKRSYKKGEVILSEGSTTENSGIVLSGMVMISCCDIWGNNSILGNAAPGSIFAEVYACIPGSSRACSEGWKAAPPAEIASTAAIPFILFFPVISLYIN